MYDNKLLYLAMHLVNKKPKYYRTPQIPHFSRLFWNYKTKIDIWETTPMQNVADIREQKGAKITNFGVWAILLIISPPKAAVLRHGLRHISTCGLYGRRKGNERPAYLLQRYDTFTFTITIVPGNLMFFSNMYFVEIFCDHGLLRFSLVRQHRWQSYI